MAGGRSAAVEATRYAAVAIGISWLVGVPAVLGDRGGWLPTPLVTAGLAVSILGPALAAVVLARTDREFDAHRLLARFRRWSFPARWWLAVPVAAAVAGVTASAPFRQAGVEYPGASTVVGALAAAPVAMAAAALEEVGWRGYLLPRLQRTVHAATASVLIAIPWGLWHLPLLLQPTGPNSQVPWWVYPAGALAGSFLYTALFNVTGGSLVIVTAVHGVRNVVSGIFLAGAEPRPDPTIAYTADVAVVMLAATALFVMSHAASSESRTNDSY